MPDIVSLDPEPLATDMVTYLEELLQRAKQGEFSSMAVAFVFRNGDTGSGWTYIPRTGPLIGAVAMLQHKLCQDHAGG